MTLSQQLNAKIDSFVDAYEHLKSENQMLREELLSTKLKLQELENQLLLQENSSEISEEDIEAIITKLEMALGKDDVE